jgi:nicotinic acetylcholine receptor
MTIAWNDSKMIWNPTDYSGIETINMKQDFLWTPDLKLYNSHIPSSLGTCHLVDCLIKYTSIVACVMPCSFTAHCKDFGIDNWPYDVQNCSFTFGSWMKTGEEMTYNTEKIKLVTSRLKKNNQWSLIGSSSLHNKGVYAFSNETFPSISFSLTIERHNGLHQVTSISSAIVLMVTNLLVLFVAPERIMRLILAIINLASISIFSEFLYWM